MLVSKKNQQGEDVSDLIKSDFRKSKGLKVQKFYPENTRSRKLRVLQELPQTPQNRSAFLEEFCGQRYRDSYGLPCDQNLLEHLHHRSQRADSQANSELRLLGIPGRTKQTGDPGLPSLVRELLPRVPDQENRSQVQEKSDLPFPQTIHKRPRFLPADEHRQQDRQS